MKKVFILIFLVFILSVNLFSQNKYKKVLLLKENSDHYIFEKKVNIRSKPSTKSESIDLVSIGEPVTILEKTKIKEVLYNIEAYWYKVKCNNKTGYIWGGLISTMEGISDFDKDGKKELLLSRCTSDKECYFDDHMAKFSHNLLLCRKGELINEKPFSSKILESSTFLIFENRGFSPEVVLIEFLYVYGDDTVFKEKIDLFYYFNGKFYFICNSFKLQNPDKYAESNITLPKENKLNNTILLENLEAIFDPKSGNLIKKTLISKIHYTWNGTKFKKAKEEKLNQLLE